MRSQVKAAFDWLLRLNGITAVGPKKRANFTAVNTAIDNDTNYIL